MKKIILLFFILSSISFCSQNYNFQFDEVDFLNVEMSEKCYNCRLIEGFLKNKTNKKIILLDFEIKYRDKDAGKDDPYYTVGKTELYNIDPRETIDFIAYIDVQNINGLDFKIELTRIIMDE